jgi:uncharacterized SAM-binding protein YcdF (DUF218 family)
MGILIARALEAVLLPPGTFVLLGLAVLLVWRRNRKSAVGLLIGTLVLLYVTSMPLGASLLMGLLERYPSLTAGDLDRSDVGAIVVLSAGRYADAPEYHGDTVKSDTLVRLRYGAHLHRLTGLPVVVTGGHLGRAESLAELMARSLSDDFTIADVWMEDRSRTTWENAEFSTELLEKKDIDTAFLVTHAFHMPRSVSAFRYAGLEVVPAPTGFLSDELARGSLAWLPSARALHASRLALHELVGMAWYRLKRLRSGSEAPDHETAASE